jgi:hypothetical protein
MMAKGVVLLVLLAAFVVALIESRWSVTLTLGFILFVAVFFINEMEGPFEFAGRRFRLKGQLAKRRD